MAENLATTPTLLWQFMVARPGSGETGHIEYPARVIDSPDLERVSTSEARAQDPLQREYVHDFVDKNSEGEYLNRSS